MRSEGRRPLFGGFTETFGDGIRVDVGLLRVLDGAVGFPSVFVLNDLVVGLPVGEFVGIGREQRRPVDEAFLPEMLDKRGTVLERLGAADLVVDGKVPGADLLKKLEPKWATPVDAEQKLTAALAEAKKAGRNVFIRFDAPW